MLALVIGLAMGLTAAYVGGRIETLIMRIVDIQLSFPAILIALILIAVLGQGTGKVVAALVTVQWAYYARTVRSAALVESARRYMEAARCVALPPSRTSFGICCRTAAPMIVVATVQVAAAIALEATLSFLGLGLPITEPSLGCSSRTVTNTCSPASTGSVSSRNRAALYDRQHQSRRRPAPRRPQSAFAEMTAPDATGRDDARLARGRSPAHPFLHEGGRGQGGRRRFVHRAEGRSAGTRRRVGVGKSITGYSIMGLSIRPVASSWAASA